MGEHLTNWGAVTTFYTEKMGSRGRVGHALDTRWWGGTCAVHLVKALKHTCFLFSTQEKNVSRETRDVKQCPGNDKPGVGLSQDLAQGVCTHVPRTWSQDSARGLCAHVPRTLRSIRDSCPRSPDPSTDPARVQRPCSSPGLPQRGEAALVGKDTSAPTRLRRTGARVRFSSAPDLAVGRPAVGPARGHGWGPHP